jgi:hypothetical protein
MNRPTRVDEFDGIVAIDERGETVHREVWRDPRGLTTAGRELSRSSVTRVSRLEQLGMRDTILYPHLPRPGKTAPIKAPAPVVPTLPSEQKIQGQPPAPAPPKSISQETEDALNEALGKPPGWLEPFLPPDLDDPEEFEPFDIDHTSGRRGRPLPPHVAAAFRPRGPGPSVYDPMGDNGGSGFPQGIRHPKGPVSYDPPEGGGSGGRRTSGRRPPGIRGPGPAPAGTPVPDGGGPINPWAQDIVVLVIRR